jgi:hypothetical protein
MLYKTTLSSGYAEGQPHIFPLEMHDFTMLKAATEMHPDVMALIQKTKPIPGKSIILVDAMGAGEYWGSNVNGDYFAEDQLCHEGLDYGYKTFEHYAYPYVEHQNEASIKDPNRRVGDRVQLAVYFQPMHRVQLVVAVSKVDPRTARIVERIDNGEYPDVSMACGVQYDQCSICGSKHKTRREYCQHARGMLNHVMDDGQKVFLFNHHPRFHDISLVFIGAEKNSKVLLKVASKQAAINKEIPADISHIGDTPEKFNKKTLKALSKYPIEDVAHAMRKKNYKMSPEDLQYMVLNSNGEEKRASVLADSGICFDTAKYEVVRLPRGVDNPLIDFIIDNRPMYKQASTDMIKSAAGESIVAPVLSGIYHAFNYTLPNAITNAVRELKAVNAPAVALGYMMGHNIASNINPQPPNPYQNVYMQPQYIPDYATPYDTSRFFKTASPWGDVWNIAKGIGNTMYAHPILSGAGVGLAAWKLAKDAEENTGISTSQPKLQALKWGGGLAGGMLLTKWLKNRGAGLLKK